mmetsp:Transcript_25593/g.70649  ORF Transcript_25593/g.70649 Transcript_25593/m.70649 type:complete len:127 (+) Transcript_25593:810-1190(+)
MNARLDGLHLTDGHDNANAAGGHDKGEFEHADEKQGQNEDHEADAKNAAAIHGATATGHIVVVVGSIAAWSGGGMVVVASSVLSGRSCLDNRGNQWFLFSRCGHWLMDSEVQLESTTDVASTREHY